MQPTKGGRGPIETVLKYYCSARKAFNLRHQPTLKRIAFATDGSTVGLVGRAVGYFSKPDNVGAWAPPVVTVE